MPCNLKTHAHAQSHLFLQSGVRGRYKLFRKVVISVIDASIHVATLQGKDYMTRQSSQMVADDIHSLTVLEERRHISCLSGCMRHAGLFGRHGFACPLLVDRPRSAWVWPNTDHFPLLGAGQYSHRASSSSAPHLQGDMLGVSFRVLKKL